MYGYGVYRCMYVEVCAGVMRVCLQVRVCVGVCACVCVYVHVQLYHAVFYRYVCVCMHVCVGVVFLSTYVYIQ